LREPNKVDPWGLVKGNGGLRKYRDDKNCDY
jgi:hypothetical protein